MKKTVKVAALTVALSITTLYAGHSHDEHSHEGHSHEGHKETTHEGHGHSHRYDAIKNEVSKESVEEAASQKVKSLVLEKKIPSSWKSMAISKIGKTHYGDSNDWVVAFDNIKIKDKKKRTLYIFVTTHGDIAGANYTGK